MNVQHNTYIRFIIKLSVSDLLKKERIDKLFNKDDYHIAQKVNKHKNRLNGSPVYDDYYIFNQYAFPGIYELIIDEYCLSVTITELDSNVHIDIIKKLFGQDEVKRDLYFINSVTCIYGERYLAKTYSELSEHKPVNLLPELKETANRTDMSTIGSSYDCNYEVIQELYKCNATVFNMEEAMSYAQKAIVENRNITGKIQSIYDLLHMMDIEKKIAYKLLFDETQD